METLAAPHRLLSWRRRFSAVPASGFSGDRTTKGFFYNARGFNGDLGCGRAAKSGSLTLVTTGRSRRAVVCLSHSSPSLGICLILRRN